MASIVNGIYQRDTLSDVRNNVRSIANDKFSDIIASGEILDTDPSSVIGRILDTYAEQFTSMEAIFDYLVKLVDLDQAEGTKLDDLVALGNVFRKSASASTALLLVTGVLNTVIPAGSSVKSSLNTNIFTTDYNLLIDTNNVVSILYNLHSGVDSYTLHWQQDFSASLNTDITYTVMSETDIDIIGNNLATQINTTTSFLSAQYISNGNIQISFSDKNNTGTLSLTNSDIINITKQVESTCAYVGQVEAISNTLTSIQSPVNGWLSVTNPFDADIGTLDQTDEELRNYYRLARSFSGNNTYNSLYADLIKIAGVKYLQISNNTQDTPNGAIQPHGFAVTIQGGDAEKIAQVIFNHTPAGIQSYGDEHATAYDLNGVPVEAYFSRPSYVPIKIKINLTQLVGFPNDGVNLIKQAIIDYFSNLTVGDDIYISRLYTPINSIPNHVINSIQITRDNDDFSTNNVVIAYNEIATINPDSITFG